ncbi:MAG: phosphotransferase enzyme family protein [Planctomycetota bacterium]
MTETIAFIQNLLQEHYPCGELLGLVSSPGTGFSGAELFRLETSSGRYALRGWESSPEQRQRLEQAFAVIRFASEQGCGEFLSSAVPSRGGERLVEAHGRLWQLSRWLEGEPNFNAAPTANKLRGAMRSLAKFHQTTARYESRQGCCNAVPCRLVECRAVANYLQLLQDPIQRESNAELQRTAWELWQRVSFRSPGLFERGQPLGQLNFLIRPVLGDLWRENVLFDGDNFSGFVDYTAIRTDAVSVDLARLLGSLKLAGRVPWAAGIEAYEQVSPLTDDEKKILPWLHESGLVLGGLNWLQWIFVHRMQFSQPKAVLQRMREVSKQLLELEEERPDGEHSLVML